MEWRWAKTRGGRGSIFYQWGRLINLIHAHLFLLIKGVPKYLSYERDGPSRFVGEGEASAAQWETADAGTSEAQSGLRDRTRILQSIPKCQCNEISPSLQRKNKRGKYPSSKTSSLVLFLFFRSSTWSPYICRGACLRNLRKHTHSIPLFIQCHKPHPLHPNQSPLLCQGLFPGSLRHHRVLRDSKLSFLVRSLAFKTQQTY
jgi:hypothetical protein